MTAFSKRKIVELLIAQLNLSKLIRRFYRIAMLTEYSNSTVEDLTYLCSFFRLESSVHLVRMGDPFDGGYAVWHSINPDSHCISVGVGTNVSFDLDIAKRLRSVHLYDHTVPRLPVEAPENVLFFKLGLAVLEDRILTTLERAISKFPVKSPLILKMDIEGAEWEILSSLDMALLMKFDQVVIEFHHLHNFHNPDFFDMMIKALSNVNTSHKVINVHANNWAGFDIIHGIAVPDVLEVTYLRRDLDEPSEIGNPNHSQVNFPCNPAMPDFLINF